MAAISRLSRSRIMGCWRRRLVRSVGSPDYREPAPARASCDRAPQPDDIGTCRERQELDVEINNSRLPRSRLNLQPIEDPQCQPEINRLLNRMLTSMCDDTSAPHTDCSRTEERQLPVRSKH